MQSESLIPIPQPPSRPLIGNLFDIETGTPVQSFMKIAQQYGPIVRMELPGRVVTLVSGHELVNELCDENRFAKYVTRQLDSLRAVTGDGLFTAWTDEPNWQKAHSVLLPNFSQQAMHSYHPMMLDLAEQLVLKWERLNAGDPVEVVDDMTRLTLDTIGLCGFGYRFNSFYREQPHPFVKSLVRSLAEAMVRVNRLPLQDSMMVHSHHQFEEDIAFMNALVDRIIAERRAHGRHDGTKDLLSYMLEGVDRQTGEKLDDLNVRYQIITFLGAGHETTSGLLSFAIYFLLQHPDVLARAYEEVDNVLGGDLNAKPTYTQVTRLSYINRILKETLRLWPTAPTFSVFSNESQVLGGKYRLEPKQFCTVLIPILHRDPSVWGENAEQFDPDRFTADREAALPPNAFKPFGNGQRACIGRQFAMQEAALVMGMILQRFELIGDTGYQLKVKETLTLKPDGLTMKIALRAPRTVKSPASDSAANAAQQPVSRPDIAAPKHGTPLLVLYGSNMGTAEAIAQEIAGDGVQRGFKASTAPLDDFVGRLPGEGAVVIVSASYNGKPPDNSVRFCDWLRSADLDSAALRNLRYCVFGCGNRDWTDTYQAVPKWIDARLESAGAQRIYKRGEADARDDFDGQFRAWYSSLWGELAKAFQLEAISQTATPRGPLYSVEVLQAQSPAAIASAYGARPMTLLENRELQNCEGPNPSERSTRHIELALPSGVTYRTGDHLGVLPRNGDNLVKRAAVRLGLSPDSVVIIRRQSDAKSSLPVDQPIRLADLFRDYVELQDVATRAQIGVLASCNECPPEKARLTALAGDDEASAGLYREEVLVKRRSILDLLEEFKATTVTLSLFLEMAPALRPRYYSISSSPLTDSARCSITVGVVSGPSRSGNGDFMGVCSNYLAQLPAGSEVQAFVRDPQSPFRLPGECAVPLILVGPGTGFAPFRGFLQERAARQKSGETLGPALVFCGCRNPDHDFLYADELRSYEQNGVVRVVTAFSRLPGQPKRYVQDEIRARSEEVWDLLQKGACIYVCGDASKMAPDVRRAFAEIFRAKAGAGEQTSEAWLNELASNHRYVVDVWAAS